MTATGQAAYVLKLDSAGSFVWAKTFEPTGGNIWGMAIDAGGNVYTTGGSATSSMLVSKISPAGNFLWQRYVGTGGQCIGQSVKVDAQLNVYTTGNFLSTVDFDPGAASYNLTSAGGPDIFISKLDNAGNFVWARQMGGSGVDDGNDIALDKVGNVYAIGNFNSTVDFDPGAGTYLLNSPTTSLNTFVCKLTAAGSFAWANCLQGSGGSEGQRIGVDPAGNVYTGGNFYNTVDFDPGAASYTFSSLGSRDVYISKQDGLGNFIWARQIGGMTNEMLRGLSIDLKGNIYSTGSFNNQVDFDPGAGTSNLNSGGSDAFISKLDSSGSFAWAKNIATGNSTGYGIYADTINVYTTGIFGYPGDFNTDAGVLTLSNTIGDASFVHKISQVISSGTDNPNTVGLQEISSIGGLKIFPNPASDVLMIEQAVGNTPAENTQVQLVNLLGQTVMQETIGNEPLQLNLKNLESGLYLLRFIQDGKTIASQKMVKQ